MKTKTHGGMRKKPKQRPPRIYRTKDGRPYIKVKGKRAYLNFGKKTNDLSTLQIVKLFMKYLGRPKRAKTKREDKKKVQSLAEIEQNTRTTIQDHLDKLKQEKYDLIESIDKKEKLAREEAEEKKKRQERKDLADAKERQEEIDREMKKEQRLIQELNAERRHRQGLLMAPLAPPMIPPPPPGRPPPKRRRGIVVKDAEEEERHKQTKREKLIDGMFAEKVRQNRNKSHKPSNEVIVRKLRFIGHNIPDIKPARGKINYSEMLRKWLYTSPAINEQILNSNQAWVEFDLWIESAIEKKREEKDREAKVENPAEEPDTAKQGAEEKKEEQPVVQEPEESGNDGDLVSETEDPGNLSGIGAGTSDGLRTNEIDDIMKKHDWYLGTIASDQINKLKPEKRKKYGFIMNTDPSTKKGQHWIAVWVSINGERSVEVYDPLAEYEPTELFQQQMKQLIDKSRPDSYLLMKVNQVKQQSDTSDTCGWHSMRFLLERAKGTRFKFSSGFTDLKEEEVNKLKSQNGYGFDTYI